VHAVAVHLEVLDDLLTGLPGGPATSTSCGDFVIPAQAAAVMASRATAAVRRKATILVFIRSAP